MPIQIGIDCLLVKTGHPIIQTINEAFMKILSFAKAKFKIDLWGLLLIVLFFSNCEVKDIQSDSRPVSHQLWDNLVKEHVDEKGNVFYKGFKDDGLEFQQYLDLLSANHPNPSTWTKDEQLAYWINAYNAFTVKLIIDNYPVESIKDIKRGIVFVNTVWDIDFIKIGGQLYSLNNIEHGIIRKKFNDPRIHFAVNCASFSCPSLRNEAYTAKHLDVQLDQQSRKFLANTDKNKISTSEIKISKIFSWYGGDFKKAGYTGVFDFIQKHTELDLDKDIKKSYLDYDWRLNGM